MLLKEIKPIGFEARLEALLEYDFGPVVLEEGQLLEESVLDTIKQGLPDYITQAKQTLQTLTGGGKALRKTASMMLGKLQNTIKQIPFKMIQDMILKALSSIGIDIGFTEDPRPMPGKENDPEEQKKVKKAILSNLKVIGLTLVAIPMVKKVVNVLSKVSKEGIQEFIQDKSLDKLIDGIKTLSKQAAPKILDPATIEKLTSVVGKVGAAAQAAAPVGAAIKAGKVAVGAAKELTAATQAARGGKAARAAYMTGGAQ